MLALREEINEQPYSMHWQYRQSTDSLVSHHDLVTGADQYVSIGKFRHTGAQDDTPKVCLEHAISLNFPELSKSGTMSESLPRESCPSSEQQPRMCAFRVPGTVNNFVQIPHRLPVHAGIQQPHRLLRKHRISPSISLEQVRLGWEATFT